MTDLVVPKSAAPEKVDNRQRRRENRRMAKEFLKDAKAYLVVGFLGDEGLKMVGDVGSCRAENDLRHIFMKEIKSALEASVNGFYANVENMRQAREQGAKAQEAKEKRSKELQGEG